MKHWLKLVGTREDPVKQDWILSQPSLLARIDFPRHRKPNDWYMPNRAIAYAVGSGAIYAVHHVVEPPFVKPAGAIGPNERWPHHVSVETSACVCPLNSAPRLADRAPEIWERYGGRKLWQQSHLVIEKEEFDHLETMIRSAPCAILRDPSG